MQKVSLQNIPASMRKGIESQLLNGTRTAYAISIALSIHINTIHAIGIHLLGKKQFELRELKAKEALLKESNQLRAQGLTLTEVGKKLLVSRSYLLRAYRNFKDSSSTTSTDFDVVEIISMTQSSADAVSEAKSSLYNAQKSSDRDNLSDQNRPLSVSDVAQHKRHSADVAPSDILAISTSAPALHCHPVVTNRTNGSLALAASTTAYQGPPATGNGPNESLSLAPSATAYQGPPATGNGSGDTSPLLASSSAIQEGHTAGIAPSSGSALLNLFASAPAQVRQEAAMSANLVSFKFRGAEFSYISGSPSESHAEKSVLNLITLMIEKGFL